MCPIGGEMILNDLKKDEMVCIYGCGQCGIQTYLFLKEKGVRVNFFCDKNPAKSGYIMDGVSCIAYDEIIKEKEKIIIIIAISRGEKLVKDFQESGFEKVLYYEDVRNHLLIDERNEETDESLMDTAADLKKLKQHVEEIVFMESVSMENKRDLMLKLVERRQA